jgi:hypothetical protein
MKPQPKSLVAWLKDFLRFCALGVAAGAGVGSFMFVRLGLPKQSYMIGYLSELFVGSGLKFGISLWFVRTIFRSLLQVWAQGVFCASHYHFRDMDLQPGHPLDRRTEPQSPAPDPNFYPQINHGRLNSTNLNPGSCYHDDSLAS